MPTAGKTGSRTKGRWVLASSSVRTIEPHAQSSLVRLERRLVDVFAAGEARGGGLDRSRDGGSSSTGPDPDDYGSDGDDGSDGRGDGLTGLGAGAAVAAVAAGAGPLSSAIYESPSKRQKRAFDSHSDNHQHAASAESATVTRYTLTPLRASSAGSDSAGGAVTRSSLADHARAGTAGSITVGTGTGTGYDHLLAMLTSEHARQASNGSGLGSKSSTLGPSTMAPSPSSFGDSKFETVHLAGVTPSPEGNGTLSGSKRGRGSHLGELQGLFDVPVPSARSDSASPAHGLHAPDAAGGTDIAFDASQRMLMHERVAQSDGTGWEITVSELKTEGLFSHGNGLVPSTTGNPTGPSHSPSQSQPSYAAKLAETGNSMARMLSPRSSRKKSSADLGPDASATAGSSRSSPAEAGDAVSQMFVIYVITATNTLTLYRTLAQLVELDEGLRASDVTSLPADKPSLLVSSASSPSPISPTAKNASRQNGHTRRRSVMATLSKTFGSSASRRASPTTPTSATAPLPPRRTPETPSTQKVNDHATQDMEHSLPVVGPLAAEAQLSSSGPGRQASPAPPLLASQLFNLSDYLTSLSSRPEIRTAPTWQAFFTPGPNDLCSSHADQREHKRMRSEGSIPADPIEEAAAYSPGKAGDRASPTPKLAASPGTPRREASEPTGNPDDSGIGEVSVLRSSAMRREVSAATSSSSMSLCVEDTPDRSTDAAATSPAPTVGDAEVLAYMQSIKEEPKEELGTADRLTTSSQEATAKGNADTANKAASSASQHESAEALLGATAADVNDDDSDVVLHVATDTSLAAEHEHETSDAVAVEDLDDAESMTQAEQQVEDHLSQIEDEIAARGIAVPQSEPVSPVKAKSQRQSASEAAPEDESAEASAEDEGVATSGTRPHNDIKAPPSGPVSIHDFEIMRVLGKGCSGKVLLARYKQRHQLYAIKAIHKKHVLAHRELAHTLTEQKILKKMATLRLSPYIVDLAWSFQDADNLFLCLDFHRGGDLATQLSVWGRLGKDRTRFYTAEIVDGLECLHTNGIIYRDLKPENVLLSAIGHVILTDFGLSKQFERKSDVVPTAYWMAPSQNPAGMRGFDAAETTMTFCGTSEYLAPEVLLGRAYSYPVDLWSLGTMVFEMLLGVTPFYNEDHAIMYRRVLHEPLSFDLGGDYLDPDTRALLRGLLNKEPEFRMTTKRVKSSKYFAAVSWHTVHIKNYIPPWCPTYDKNNPTHNFDEAFLKMDLAFVDEEDAPDAKNDPSKKKKKPDEPLDEFGQDVFRFYDCSTAAGLLRQEEDLLFGIDVTGILAERETHPDHEGSEDQEDDQEEHETEGNSQTEDARSASPPDNDTPIAEIPARASTASVIREEERSCGDASQNGGPARNTERRDTSESSATSSPSTDAQVGHFKDDSDEPEGYRTGSTSVDVTDDDQSRHTKEFTGHDRGQSTALTSLAEEEVAVTISPVSIEHAAEAKGEHPRPEVEVHESEEVSVSPRMSLEYAGRPSTEAAVRRASSDQPRPSVEMTAPKSVDFATKVSSEMLDESEQPRRSLEGDDWDVVESMDTQDFAWNGRKRVMAGPTYLARGFVDKLKAVPREGPGPKRSYTSRTPLVKRAAVLSPGASSTNLAKLSPSPSIGETSKPPSVEMPSPASAKGNGGSKGPAQLRQRAPKLLRASTDWMTSSLPASPSPKFRLKKGKKDDAALLQAGKSSATTEHSIRAATPASADSSATLPLGASSAYLPPLTRQGTREQTGDADQQSGLQSETGGDDSATPVSPDTPRRAKSKRFVLDPSRLNLSLFQSKGSTSSDQM